MRNCARWWDTCNFTTFWGYNCLCQCSRRMWTVISHAKDIDFTWALWYGKCPRSFADDCLTSLYWKAISHYGFPCLRKQFYVSAAFFLHAPKQCFLYIWMHKQSSDPHKTVPCSHISSAWPSSLLTHLGMRQLPQGKDIFILETNSICIFNPQKEAWQIWSESGNTKALTPW